MHDAPALLACHVAHVLLANHRMYNECRALMQCLNPSAPRRNHPDCWSARMLPPLFGRMSTRPHPPPAIRIQVALTISGEPLERLSTSEGPLYRVSTSRGAAVSESTVESQVSCQSIRTRRPSCRQLCVRSWLRMPSYCVAGSGRSTAARICSAILSKWLWLSYCKQVP